MADNLYFSRDTKLYATFKNASGTVQAAFELPILDGFSFSQANNTSEITLSEMESSTGRSRRGRRLFNDSLAPAEWSFSTYVRPFESAGSDYVSGDNHCVEEVLWAQMAGADSYNDTTDEFESVKFAGVFSDDLITNTDATDLDVTFEKSNRAVLQPMDLYFVMETNAAEPVVYKLQDACVNEANITFEVDGIATIEWSGFAKDIKDWTANTTVSGTPAAATDGDIILDSSASNAFNYDNGSTLVTAKDEGVTDTDNFIRNRLTQMTISPADVTTFPGDGAGADRYNLTLTGGSITISNNIEYLTPEEIGKVNIPLENVTGARAITGSFTCYVNYVDGANGGTSTNFFDEFKSAAALEIVTNEFGLNFSIGGTTGKRLVVNMPKAHVEIPVTNIEDVISFETNFHGLGTSISDSDEVSLQYFGA
jgi:hypothetical protein